MTFKPFQNLYQHIRQTDPRLHETLDRINGYLQQLTETTNSTSTVTNLQKSTLLVLTLTSNVAITSPVYPSDGSLLIVLLIQNGTGGHIPSWDISFGTVDDPGSLDPNTYNTYVFVGFLGRWWLVSINITNIQ